MQTENKLRTIAIHLPQFHPIPENDAWWGKGFTEWTNVTKAKPRFKGHYQPHIPADLGFYDLRLGQSLLDQALMAKANGIDGFMFYHYWFSGKRILEQPVNIWLESKNIDFPFCLCWANENWSRRWDGEDHELLLKQTYSLADDALHFEALLHYFKDERYIKINNKPVFAVYRTNLFPDIKATATLWNEKAKQNGFEGMYLITVESFNNRVVPADIGFDAALDFQPDFYHSPNRYFGTIKDRILHKLGVKTSPFVKDAVLDYEAFVQKQIERAEVIYKRFPGITPMWDNSARRKINAYILKDATPEKYKKWLAHVVDTFKPYSASENFVFINAWNEWAEGNHLEPCQKWGRKYLEATREILKKTQ